MGIGPVTRLVVAVFLVGFVAACGGKSTEELEYVERPVEELYNEAHDALVGEKYRKAAQLFDEVERQHPYSSWARRSMLMSAFAYYQVNAYDEAILSAQRFISLHPGNKDAPYAFYLVGICYYEQISDVGRDQKVTELALNSLREVVRRFPKSEYARDARLKAELTQDHLAGKEMEIGRWYLNQGNIIAAVNRFRNVIERYQTTAHTAEALHRLVEAYLQLGVRREAQTAAAVLGHNFPGSDWYIDSYRMLEGVDLRPQRDDDSWISKALKGLS